MASWSAITFLYKVFVPAAACLGVALLPMLHAASVNAQSPPVESRPAADTNAVVATYDGGKITAADLAEYRNEPFFRSDAEQNAPPNVQISDDEKLARHLAAIRILIKTAHAKGFDKGPEWQLHTKLSRQRALAQTLNAQFLADAQVSEREISEQFEKDKFHLIRIEAIEARRIGISSGKHGEKALARAREALGLIRGGEDFSAVAEKFSDLEPGALQVHPYKTDRWGEEAAMIFAELGKDKITEPLPVADGFEIVKAEKIYFQENGSPGEVKELIRMTLTMEAVNQRIDKMIKAAGSALAITVADAASETENKAAPDAAALRCGQFVLTRAEALAWATARGLFQWDERQAAESIRRDLGDWNIQTGELARIMGLDRRPDVQKALRYEVDRELSERAANALFETFLMNEATFDEDRIRRHYESDFKATLDPLLQYDALVVPVRITDGATAEERQATEEQAKARAEDLLAQIQRGTNINALLAADSTLQWIPDQSRVTEEGSPLERLAARVKPGEVIPQPYPDFGGYCVLRVTFFEPTRKQPFQMARGYIIDHFRHTDRTELRRNFETILLKKHHFAFGPPAAAAHAKPSETAATTVSP